MPDDQHDGGDPAAVVARLDANDSHKAFLHRTVRVQLRRGISPIDIRIESDAITAKVAAGNSSWTSAEVAAYEAWHASAVERFMNAPLIEEN